MAGEHITEKVPASKDNFNQSADDNNIKIVPTHNIDKETRYMDQNQDAENLSTSQNHLNHVSAEENNSNTSTKTNEDPKNMSEMQIIQKLNNLDDSSIVFITFVSKLVDLNLNSCRLSCLPDSFNLLRALKCLSLNNNCLLRLPNIICELKNLRELSATHNRLIEVPNNLGTLWNLEILDLSCNNLKDLPQSCLRLNRLRICRLNDNNFKKIPDCVAKGMSKLEIFDFSRNFAADLNIYPKSTKLTMFRANGNSMCPFFPKWILISAYNKLETVSLNDTRFKSLKFRRKIAISYVKQLSMSQCNLEQKDVERIIAGMTKLEELNLGSNKFHNPNYCMRLPIAKMKEPIVLKRINAYNIGIAELPKEIGKCIYLTDINLSQNTLYNFPDEICLLKNLNSLKIDNNRLINFPDNFGNLVSLRELKARHNHLYKLPDSMRLLSNLEFVDLYNNDFEEAPAVLENLQNLKGLDLEKNCFSTENLWDTRDCNYICMRDTLRQHWVDPVHDFACSYGPKENSSSTENCSSPSGSFSDKNLSSEEKEYSFNTEVTPMKFEHWDSSEDSADEFDPHVYKEPKKRMYSPFTFYKPFQQVYCPADYHQKGVMSEVYRLVRSGKIVWNTTFEDGQFDDP